MSRAPDDFVPMLLGPNSPLVFPDPTLADAGGLVAVGGDLSPERLVLAYSHAIFPWYDDDNPPLWWSPDPRCILPVDGLHVSRRLERRMRRDDYDVTWNEEFEQVMRMCSVGRNDGTWITEEMVDAYLRLHERGNAHSLEIWQDGELVGGVYGVQVGSLFAAESKFRRRTDMSKIAVVALARTLACAGIQLIDVQFRTEHLVQFGCVEVPRRVYLELARRAAAQDCDLAKPDLVW